MKTDCNYYFLTSTAKQIWISNDTQGESRMFECLSSVHKNSFFNKVIFKDGIVPEFKSKEFAEDAFVLTWQQLREKGRQGNFSIEQDEYTWYFFRSFKFNYLKQLEKEIKLQKAIKDYGKDIKDKSYSEKDNSFSWRTQSVLDKLSEGCRQLIIWKYVENLSHDEIAEKRNIARKTSITLVSRCSKKFWDIWNSNVEKK